MLHGPTVRECLLVLLCFISILYGSSFLPEYDPLRDVSAPHWNLSAHLASVPRQTYESRLSWGRGPVPSTKVIAHTPGWTICDKLYVFNGIVYLVTEEPEKAPRLDQMYSNGDIILPGKDAEASRLPSDSDMRIISPREAKSLFGTGAQILDGVSFLVNDPPQFVTHYYHWSAELWYGFWRTYSSLDPVIPETGNTTLPPPRRLIFNRLDNNHWRDYAAMNQEVLRSSFPSISLEFIDDWRDRAEMNVPWVFERVVLADRSAAMPAYNYQRYQRTAAVPFGLPGSASWWLTLRNNVVQFAGIDANALPETPVITYISRQGWGRRMLIPADHDKLVQELNKLHNVYGYEINIVEADKMTRKEQIRLAARTTIMMGVHGNGLTSLLWMKPTPRSTVIEFFFPGGFAHDYEFTTRAMGMTHYGFWGSHHFTSPSFPQVAYPDGFQGNSIPIDGAAVARLCHERLSNEQEVDD